MQTHRASAACMNVIMVAYSIGVEQWCSPEVTQGDGITTAFLIKLPLLLYRFLFTAFFLLFLLFYFLLFVSFFLSIYFLFLFTALFTAFLLLNYRFLQYSPLYRCVKSYA